MFKRNAPRFVHPDDLDIVLLNHTREQVIRALEASGSYTVSCRMIMDGKIVHVRHVDVLCEDKKHVLFGMENIDDEVREREKQKQKLQSAQRMARMDKLTGIKNRNAFTEYSQAIDNRIRSCDRELRFGLVMCDVNDLKRFNDTRGHSFGDEILRRSCRMICEVYQNSQVFRNGGDEFVVVLTGEEYEIREELLENLRRESRANSRSRSGPVIASGMAVFEPAKDASFSDVFKRADLEMYENKKLLKSGKRERIHNATETETPVPDERRRKLDSLFGAFLTIAGEGYVYLNDLRYDFSRWSFSLVDDFALESEYMYHAGKIWQEYVHPDDLAQYREVVDAVISGTSDMRYLRYRVRRPDGAYIVVQPRAFVMSDANGDPEYFGGIIVPQ